MSESASESVVVDSRYDWERTVPSVAVVEALAGAEGATPDTLATELDAALHDYVSADALDTLVTEGEDVTVSFSVGSYRVRIADDRLTVARDGPATGRV